MIGRTEKVKPFELIRWARQRARVHSLSSREAHVLLLLATYANDEATSWPSIRTLALDCGLRPTKDGRNSSVSAAIGRLEELHLVWTKQGGSGASARRELLFDPVAWREELSGMRDGSASQDRPQPSGLPDGCTSQPSGQQDGTDSVQPACPDTSLPASRTQPSGLQDQKCQRNGHEELPNSNGQRKPSGYAEGYPSHSQDGTDDDPLNVRQQIAASLASTRRITLTEFAAGLQQINDRASAQGAAA